MKTFIINSILLFFMCSLLNTNASQTSFTHTQTFKWNKKIWGTYNLKNEHILYQNGKRTWRRNITEKMSDIIFQGKNLILIKEQKLLPNQSTMTSQSFLYLSKDKRIKITDLTKKAKLAKLFTSDIHKNLSGNEYRDGEVIYDDFRCERNKKSTLTCIIKGRIQESVNKVTLK